MSLFSYPIGREAPISQKLTDDSYTTLVTAGDNGGTVLGLRVSEIAGSTPTIIIDVYDGTNSVVELCNGRAFTAREVWEPIRAEGVPVVLLPGHSLRAKASTGNQLHCTGVHIEPPQLG